MTTNPSDIGRVLNIALRRGVGGPMEEVTTVQGQAGAGLAGDNPAEPDRGVTLLSARQWEQVLRETGKSLPWHTRRANVLLDTDGLGPLIGKRIEVGELLLVVTGETRPCGQMDSACAGLRDALRPDCRGGVTCRIDRGGTLRVGAVARIVD